MPKRRAQLRDIVLVEWTDSHSTTKNRWDWFDSADERCHPMKIRTAGFLVSSANGHYLIASSLSAEDSPSLRTGCKGEIVIPKRCVTKLIVLRARLDV